MRALRVPLDGAHGVPRRGYVLSSAVEEIARHCRVVIATLSRAFQRDDWAAQPFVWCKGGLASDRAAWHVLATWLTRQAVYPSQPSLGLADTVEWYLGTPIGRREVAFWRDQDAALAATLDLLSRCSGIKELLPYVLESHGPGSRLSVLRDPSTRAARATKKGMGVFYTPPDVADFTARSVMDMVPAGRQPKILDPAVGTGVFLRAALIELRRRWPEVNPFYLSRDYLFGLDIDHLALDGAASVLLADTLCAAEMVTDSPVIAWRMLRRNLVCRDALTVDRTTGLGAPNRISLEELFPAAAEGFDIVIGNPPYAELGKRSDIVELARHFQTIDPDGSSKADMYPAFVEQMVRLAASGAVGAMVLPLSIACNSGRQFAACRTFIERQPGQWQFSFFDRQPHALFGEDVKTRNAIVLWNGTDPVPRVMTGPLRRWRGDDRAVMLAEIGYTPIATPIADGVPKLHGHVQAEVWSKLVQVTQRLGGLIQSSARSSLSSVPSGTEGDVYVAPTAYNFIGLARPHKFSLRSGEIASENPLHKLHCADSASARAVYAVLASNFAYWWWQVTGDGFHVNRSTLLNLPVGFDAFDHRYVGALSTLGGALWEVSSQHPVRSLNRGRVSLAFTPDVAPELRRQIDACLCEAMALPDSFAGELALFTETMQGARLFGRHVQEKQKENNKMSQKVSADIKEKSKLTKEEWRDYTKTVWSIANKGREDHPAVFPPEIPHRLTKLFSFYGETVLDPFGGTGTTARAAIPLGRRAVCVDQNPDYVNIIRKECASLRNGHADDFVALDAVHGDSRNMSFLESNSVGLVVTSPPYWDKANYGQGKNNLGNIANYAAFLENMKSVFEECYRVLIPGRKMCVVTANVNQHTDQGLLTFPLATDFAVLLRNIGFVMVNEIIWSKDGTGGKWGSYGAQRPIFGSYPYPPNFLFKNVHEYILIFAKPSLVKTKGPKVKAYKDLMAGMEDVAPFAVHEEDGAYRMPMVEM